MFCSLKFYKWKTFFCTQSQFCSYEHKIELDFNSFLKINCTLFRANFLFYYSKLKSTNCIFLSNMPPFTSPQILPRPTAGPPPHLFEPMSCDNCTVLYEILTMPSSCSCNNWIPCVLRRIVYQSMPVINGECECIEPSDFPYGTLASFKSVLTIFKLC